MLTLKDEDFVEEIYRERSMDSEANSRQSKRELVGKTSTMPVWDLKINKDANPDTAEKNKEKIEAANTDRFKKTKSRQETKAFDLDFSPGML